MRLTTRSSYGVRALINLAIVHATEKPVSLKQISREENISKIFLDQIFNQLKKQNLVKSVRGPKGGYILAKDPSEISVFEIVSILEGDVFTEKCLSGKTKDKMCTNSGRCASGEVWTEVAQQIKKTLDKFSLRDLANRTIEIDPSRSSEVMK